MLIYMLPILFYPIQEKHIYPIYLYTYLPRNTYMSFAPCMEYLPTFTPKMAQM